MAKLTRRIALCQVRRMVRWPLMQLIRSSLLRRVLTVLAVLVVCKVTASPGSQYRPYFPPDFQSDFLRGREAYFWGAYRWAFYAHLISGPASRVLGVVLLRDTFRRIVPSPVSRKIDRLAGVCSYRPWIGRAALLDCAQGMIGRACALQKEIRLQTSKSRWRNRRNLLMA